ncbi:hypothetical protein [Shimazuella kribbensis]|uniref:hypothetical protein n=1 Tax=Shimazuella kribbensis TaxID=139808 RepID=UPI0004077B58|nr:hypothetical protein [Shimazuella kribbensis]
MKKIIVVSALCLASLTGCNSNASSGKIEGNWNLTAGNQNCPKAVILTKSEFQFQQPDDTILKGTYKKKIKDVYELTSDKQTIEATINGEANLHMQQKGQELCIYSSKK